MVPASLVDFTSTLPPMRNCNLLNEIESEACRRRAGMCVFSNAKREGLEDLFYNLRRYATVSS